MVRIHSDRRYKEIRQLHNLVAKSINEGMTDQEVADLLKSQASPRTLRSMRRDIPRADRAGNRLLRLVNMALGEPQPETDDNPDVTGRFLFDMEVSAAFEVLCEREPRLRVTVARILSGEADTAVQERLVEGSVWRSDTGLGIDKETARRASLIRQELDPLVGPRSRSSEPLLRSFEAAKVVERFLLESD